MAREPSLTNCRRRLHAGINRFDAAAVKERKACLQRLADAPVTPGAATLQLMQDLLFTIAHPSDPQALGLAERVLRHLTRRLRLHPRIGSKVFANSGLPFSRIVGRFSHDALRHLMAQARQVRVQWHSLDGTPAELRTLLQHTLPAFERTDVSSPSSALSLLDELGVPSDKRLPWLVSETSKLDETPSIKDHLFDQLGVYVDIIPRLPAFTLGYNRLPVGSSSFVAARLRDFDVRSVVDRSLPAPDVIPADEMPNVIRVIRNALALLARETDPATYLDPGSLRAYSLDRGLRLVFYTMTPDRQLPYESYVGYTAFRNGLPVAYGGSWIFGDRALFGLNIFPAYRGGESAWIMAQLLRGYRQLFRVRHFEVDPYQFGLDNPEGIATGAFWFYYRFGFRPLDKKIRRLADDTYARMKSESTYTCPVRVLESFTASPLALAFGHAETPPLLAILDRLSHMIRTRFRGDRVAAVTTCREDLLERMGHRRIPKTIDPDVFDEMALWASAYRLNTAKHLREWPAVMRNRVRDVYAYQASLRKLLAR